MSKSPGSQDYKLVRASGDFAALNEAEEAKRLAKETSSSAQDLVRNLANFSNKRDDENNELRRENLELQKKVRERDSEIISLKSAVKIGEEERNNMKDVLLKKLSEIQQDTLGMMRSNNRDTSGSKDSDLGSEKPKDKTVSPKELLEQIKGAYQEKDAATQEKIDSLEEENKLLSDKLEKYKDGLISLRAKLQKEQDELTRVKEGHSIEVSGFKSRIVDLESKISAEENSKTELRKSLEVKNAQLAGKLEQANIDATHMRKAIADLEAENSSLQTGNDTAESRNKALRLKLDKVELQLKEVNKDLRSTKKSLSQASEKISEQLGSLRDKKAGKPNSKVKTNDGVAGVRLGKHSFGAARGNNG